MESGSGGRNRQDMAVHGALAELSRRFDRPRLPADARALGGTVLADTRRIGFGELLCGENASPHALEFDSCVGVGTVDESVVEFHRGSVDAQLAGMVKLAVEVSRRGRVSGRSRAALQSSVARQVGRAARGELGDRIGAVRTFLRRPLWLVSRAGAVMLVSTLGAGTAFATADALPDDPLHEAKLATEQLRLSLAQSAEQRVVVELDIAGARLHEAVVLGTQGRDTSAEVAVSGYGEHLANAAATLQEIQPAPPALLVEQLRAQVARQQESVAAAQLASPSGDESQTALRILSEVAATVAGGSDVGPERIADSAALAAAKAAASVQRRAEPSMNVGGSAAPSVAATSAAPTQPASPIPTGSAAAGNAGSAPTATTATTAAVTSTQAPALVVATQNPASSAAPATTSAAPTSTAAAASSTVTAATSAVPPLPPAAPAAAKDKKTEAAAKAATESAERAKHAAERAKQAAEKSARDAEHAKKQQQDQGQHR
jgi:uncharacterized protein DUF5667